MECKTDRALRVAGVADDSITDGPGIRFAVFTQGCPHHCPGCHNPETFDFGGGTETTLGVLLAQIDDNPLLKGVTFSGGEPMCQAGALAALAGQVKRRGLELAVYTGYTFEQLLAEADADRLSLLALCDILVDGPFLQDERSLELRFMGSRNQRVLDAQASLAQKEAVLSQDERWL